MTPVPTPIHIGDRVTLVMPMSEVCIHLGIVGQQLQAELLPSGMIQLYKDGNPYSFPITSGEAGVFTREDGSRYYYIEI